MAFSPTVRRRRLAAELRTLRESAGLTLEQAADQIEISKSALSRIENVKAVAKVPYVRLLLDLYGVESEVKDDLVRVAREARQKGSWHHYGPALPPGLESLMGLEAGASRLSQFGAVAIPGLLQTRAYAEASMREHAVGEPGEVISKRIEARLWRQSVLQPDQGFEACFVLEEAVLRREVGGRQVMAGQLRHLLDVASAGVAAIHVLPFSAGEHPMMVAPFLILEFREGSPVVHVELLDLAKVGPRVAAVRSFLSPAAGQCQIGRGSLAMWHPRCTARRYGGRMRLGVLDIGSNTVHLLVVDAHPGAHPWPAHSEKAELRLAERIGPDGRLSSTSADALIEVVAKAKASAERLGTEDLLAFATSAVRDATNAAKVLARIRDETGVDPQVLPGEEEAAMTFLAVRRWYGWSAGRLLVIDIGGGSLEIAAGIDEEPDTALSLPLGAGRLTRTWFSADPPPADQVGQLREYVRSSIDAAAQRIMSAGWDRPIATSKTFRTLARLTGAAPSSAGPRPTRRLTHIGLRQLIGFISRMQSSSLAEMEGVSSKRAHQVLAGAIVAEATMRRLDIDAVEICPWALREGVILRRLDMLASG